MIAPKTKKCFNCKKPDAVYNWNDLCHVCQRAAWLAEERAIQRQGGEPFGLLPPEVPSQWKTLKGTHEDHTRV